MHYYFLDIFLYIHILLCYKEELIKPLLDAIFDTYKDYKKDIYKYL